MRNSQAERNDTFLSIYEKESVIIVPTSYTEIKREIEYPMSNILTRIQLNTEQNKEKVLGSYQNVIKGWSKRWFQKHSNNYCANAREKGNSDISDLIDIAGNIQGDPTQAKANEISKQIMVDVIMNIPVSIQPRQIKTEDRNGPTITLLWHSTIYK